MITDPTSSKLRVTHWGGGGLLHDVNTPYKQSMGPIESDPFNKCSIRIIKLLCNCMQGTIPTKTLGQGKGVSLA